MNKKLLIYRMDQIPQNQSIKMICRLLNIELVEIDDFMIHLKLKDILNKKTRKRKNDSLKMPMIVFSGMSQNDIDLLLQSFKNAAVPFIPLKAMITATNLHWSFSQLFDHIFAEYQQVVQKSQKL